MTRRVATLVALAFLAAAPAAHADGDPASDYLLGRSTFIPPDVGIPPAYATQLEEAVREAKIRGYTIRVALIGSRYDLGSVTVLYEQPKRYARFLGMELAIVYKGKLLVVMPNGLGVSQDGKALRHEQAIVDRIGAPGNSGKALAETATNAVLRLAGSAGVFVPAPPLPAAGRAAPGSNTKRDRIVIALAALAAALAAAGSLLYRRRRAA